MEQKIDKAVMEPIERVKIARHPKRPNSLDFLAALFTDFTELHGDGLFAEDGAIVTGLARLGGRSCVVIAEVKGKTIEENNIRNFGSPHPEGYRKSKRVGELAERFGLPVISFIDTSGAYPGIGAEERGQGRAIAENLMFFSRIKTPVIAVVVGEGGSGGALAVGIADRVLMLENAIYSVISPEGCSSILFKSADRAAEVAKSLKITSPDLLELSAIDEIIEEGPEGAHNDFKTVSENLKKSLEVNLDELAKTPLKKLVENRYKKFRNMFGAKNEA